MWLISIRFNSVKSRLMGKIVPGIGRKVIKKKVYSLALPMRSLLKCLMKAQRNTRSV